MLIPFVLLLLSRGCRSRPIYVKLGARSVDMNAELHPQAVGNIAWVSSAVVAVLVHRRLRVFRLSTKCVPLLVATTQ